MVIHLLGDIFGVAPDDMSYEGHDEQQHEGQAERVLIEPKNPTTFPDRPRRVRPVSEITRIGIGQFDRTGPARLRRSSLDEARRQKDEDRHLQKFALPILKDGFPGMAGRKVLGHHDTGPAVFALGRVVIVLSGNDLTDEEQYEHRHQDQGQGAIADPTHLVTCPSGGNVRRP